MKLLPLVRLALRQYRNTIDESKRIKVLEETIATIRKQHRHAKEKEMTYYERVYNAGLYVLLLEYEFAILKSDAFYSFREWKRSFVARQLAIFLYEASQDLPVMLGKDFREALAKIGTTDDEIKELNTITKSMTQFKNDHRSTLYKIRNIAGAHRDKDAALQLEVIESVELLELMKLAGDYYVAMRDLMPFLTKIVTKLGKLEVMLKHVNFEKL